MKKMIDSLQTILLTIVATLIVVSFSMREKQKFIDSQLTTLEYKLRVSTNSGELSNDDFYASKDLMRPLRYPMRDDPWLLRNDSDIIFSLFIAHGILSFVCPKRKESDDSDLPPLADRSPKP